ncbi:MAG: thioredoxin family protein [Methanosarcinales archaeon]|nr:thioredoxin family protein [Methanosarcinales archaeon]
MQDKLIVEATDGSWEQLVEREPLPVVVMFYLTTCPHCKAIEPYFREYAGEFKKSCKFVRIDAERSPWTAERYGVEGTPTFVFLCGGTFIQGLAGVSHPAVLKRNIEDFIKDGATCASNITKLKYDISLYE